MNRISENKVDQNPFLEVLPSRLSSMDFFKKVQQLPSFTKNGRLPSDPMVRRTIINQVLHNWFHVNASHYDIYERLIDVISEGYRLRHQEGSYKILENTINWNENASDPDFLPPRISKKPVEGFSFLGVTGLGKSLLVETILETCLIQTYKHKWTTQVVYLKMNCTSIGSIKSLCHSFFKSLDEVIGTDYFNKYLNTKYSAERLIPVMANVAARHHLGVLIIDEINHLADVKGTSKNQILNFLKNLNASIGLPIVYIGTPEAFPILRGNFQQARRTQGIGTPIWDRLKENDPEWDRLIKALWKNQVLLSPGPLTEGLKRTYYELSQGILDPLIKLHVGAQKRALLLGVETIDEELLYIVSKDDFGFTNPILNALRVNDIDVLSTYRDVSLKAIDISKHLDHEEANRSNQEQLQNFFTRDFTTAELKMCMQFILERAPSLKPSQLLKKAVNTLETIQKKTRTSSRKNKPNGLLTEAINKKKKDVDIYKSLKNMGLVKPLNDFLALQNP